MKEHDKTRIDATIIADSVNEQGDRITSFLLTFPRIVLAELNTHRMFSRNSASSRAIPFKRMLGMVEENPFVPIAWQKDHSGMQGNEYWTNAETIQEALDVHTPAVEYFERKWLETRNSAVHNACHLANQGLTKQLVNRTLESFMWHTVIVTATEFENFFHLRCPQYEVGDDEKAGRVVRSRSRAVEIRPELEGLTDLDWLGRNRGGAEIHISRLAELMWDEYRKSEPRKLSDREWHVPFGETFDEDRLRELSEKSGKNIETLKVCIATARCARVSYVNYEGKDDYEADLKLYERLSSMGHWSPFEHCAECMTQNQYEKHVRGQGVWNEEGTALKFEDDVFGWNGNFRGFTQLRKKFGGENVT